MKTIKIIVATHKKYQMPKDNIYLPLHVGGKGKEDLGFLKDDSGDNISEKNPYFCELTGMYWAWKNLDADYIGLCHYRRYFTTKKSILKKEDEKFKIILNEEEVNKILEETDIILPKKRKYYIENLYSHYKHTMNIEPLDITKNIIEEKYPQYIVAFNQLKKKNSAHMFNMCIMKKELFHQYCEWLFDILFELEKRVDYKKYDNFHARFFGRISELLLDVWINTNKMQYKEIKVMDMQNINWFKKGLAFLMAKFLKKKYKNSF